MKNKLGSFGFHFFVVDFISGVVLGHFVSCYLTLGPILDLSFHWILGKN